MAPWKKPNHSENRLFLPEFHLSCSQISPKPWGGWLGGFKDLGKFFPPKKRFCFIFGGLPLWCHLNLCCCNGIEIECWKIPPRICFWNSFIVWQYPLGDHSGVTWQNYEAVSKYRLVWTKCSLEILSLFKRDHAVHKHTCSSGQQHSCIVSYCFASWLQENVNFLSDVLRSRTSFMEMVICNIFENLYFLKL